MIDSISTIISQYKLPDVFLLDDPPPINNRESNEELFERINNLYRRALKQRLNILDEDKLKRSFVVDTNKFSLAKLRYTVSEIERYSFVDGKNSFDGKDILGDFFELMLNHGVKQSEGQFFTPLPIVRFMVIGIGIGTDYNPGGLSGIGPKKALEMVKTCKNVSELLKKIKNEKIFAQRNSSSRFNDWCKIIIGSG